MNAARRQMPLEGDAKGLSPVQIGAALTLVAMAWMVAAMPRSADFPLIEILAVIAAMLVGAVHFGHKFIATLAVLGVMISATALVMPARCCKRDRASSDLVTIKNGVDVYYARKGKYPDSSVGLKALVDAQVFEKMPLDPWRNEYVYLLENGKPVIKTYAKDGQEGGDGDNQDITSKDILAK